MRKKLLSLVLWLTALVIALFVMACGKPSPMESPKQEYLLIPIPATDQKVFKGDSIIVGFVAKGGKMVRVIWGNFYQEFPMPSDGKQSEWRAGYLVADSSFTVYYALYDADLQKPELAYARKFTVVQRDTTSGTIRTVIRIESTPSLATVIDKFQGQERTLGQTPYGWSLITPGLHEFTLRGVQGYHDSTFSRTFAEGDSFKYQINLRQKPVEPRPQWADSSFHIYVYTNRLVDSVVTDNPAGTVDRARVQYTFPPSDQTGEAATLMWHSSVTDLWYQVQLNDSQGIGSSLIWIGFSELPVDANEKFYWLFSGIFGMTPNSLHLYGVGGYEGTGGSAMTKRGGGSRGQVVTSRSMPAMLKEALAQ